MSPFRRYEFCLALVCCLAAACGNPESADSLNDATPQELDVRLREILVLGDDDSASQEYLFGWPRFVVADSQGRIYVADEAVMNIRVYDAAGRYLHTIGRRGQGPGEFQRLQGMTINEQDELITLDRDNARLTRFSPEGEVRATYPTRISAVSEIRPFKEGYLILNNHAVREGSNDDLFRHYTPDFQDTTAVFGSVDEIIDLAERLEQVFLASAPGFFTFIDSGVLYAPSVYEGKLYLYSEEQGQWKQTRQWRGHVEKRAYTRVVDGPLDRDHADFVRHYAGKKEGALVHNRSMGLFRLQDGRIVHFTFCEFGNERVFGVEVFDEDGSLTGYEAIEKVPLTAHGKVDFFVTIGWKDDQDRFYINDRRETPVIRVVELEIGASTEVAGSTQQ